MLSQLSYIPKLFVKRPFHDIVIHLEAVANIIINNVDNLKPNMLINSD